MIVTLIQLIYVHLVDLWWHSIATIFCKRPIMGAELIKITTVPSFENYNIDINIKR